MKFIIKTEVSLFKEAFKNVFLVLFLMIPGSFVISTGFAVEKTLGIIFTTLCCVFIFVVVVLNVIKAVLINVEIEKILDETKEEKLLKAILKELKTSNKANGIINESIHDDVKSNFEAEHRERLEKK